jgi:hypothetical protein
MSRAEPDADGVNIASNLTCVSLKKIVERVIGPHEPN